MSINGVLIFGFTFDFEFFTVNYAVEKKKMKWKKSWIHAVVKQNIQTKVQKSIFKQNKKVKK